MEAADVFYTIFSIIGVIFIIIFAYVSYLLIVTLFAIRKALKAIEETKQSLSIIQSSLKIGAYSVIAKLLGRVRGT
jgi:hypothetical protein